MLCCVLKCYVFVILLLIYVDADGFYETGSMNATGIVNA